MKPLAWGRRAMLRTALGLLGIAVIATVALVGCGGGNGGGGTSEPTAHSLSGQITVKHMQTYPPSGMRWGGDSCRESGGYSDMREGAQVVVKDGSGSVIAVGALGPGEAPGAAGEKSPDCQFPFSVAGIPVEEFYSIEVSHRGATTFSHDELEAQGWTVSLSLGP
jgi:hypothetical protein